MEQLDKEFENFIRKNLDQQPAEPDADLWDAIAQEQGKRNAGLRRRWWLRRLGQWAAVLAVVLYKLPKRHQSRRQERPLQRRRYPPRPTPTPYRTRLRQRMCTPMK
jgi:hypothetical protein